VGRFCIQSHRHRTMCHQDRVSPQSYGQKQPRLGVRRFLRQLCSTNSFLKTSPVCTRQCGGRLKSSVLYSGMFAFCKSCQSQNSNRQFYQSAG
jgi:hypothetical protein